MRNSSARSLTRVLTYNYDKINTAFLSNKLTLRGTTVAIFDYADYNEKILGNKSIITTRDYEKIKNEWDVDIKAYEKFKFFIIHTGKKCFINPFYLLNNKNKQ